MGAEPANPERIDGSSRTIGRVVWTVWLVAVVVVAAVQFYDHGLDPGVREESRVGLTRSECLERFADSDDVDWERTPPRGNFESSTSCLARYPREGTARHALVWLGWAVGLTLLGWLVVGPGRGYLGRRRDRVIAKFRNVRHGERGDWFYDLNEFSRRHFRALLAVFAVGFVLSPIAVRWGSDSLWFGGVEFVLIAAMGVPFSLYFFVTLGDPAVADREMRRLESEINGDLTALGHRLESGEVLIRPLSEGGGGRVKVTACQECGRVYHRWAALMTPAEAQNRGLMSANRRCSGSYDIPVAEPSPPSPVSRAFELVVAATGLAMVVAGLAIGTVRWSDGGDTRSLLIPAAPLVFWGLILMPRIRRPGGRRDSSNFETSEN